MTESLHLTIHYDPAAARWERKVAERYWSSPRLEFGRAQWPTTLHEAAAEFGLSLVAFTSHATDRSYVTVAGFACGECGKSAVFRTRGELQKLTTARRHNRPNRARCLRCRKRDD